MKTCAPATALILLLNACSGAPAPSGGGGTGQAITTPTPAIDSRLLGVWRFDGQIRGGSAFVCGVDMACTNEVLQLTADGVMVMTSTETGTLHCKWSADGAALTYQCNGAPVTHDYSFNNAGDLVCIWQNTGLAYCYMHQ